jgi:hypothetical protein
VLYLSPVWHTLQPNMRHRFGYMQNLHNGGVSEGIRAGYAWMLDNGAFSDKWSEAKWLAALELWQPYTATCIAAVCPDVVGDAAATLTRFWQYAPVIREHGYKVAFVTQDGLTLDAAPWGEFDCLFIGGTDRHKLDESWLFILAAKERGKWVHVGRVNSASRIESFWMADSVDGTTLAIEPSIRNQQRMNSGVSAANAKKGTIPLCFT